MKNEKKKKQLHTYRAFGATRIVNWSYSRENHKRQENNVCTHDGLTWMWFHFYLFDILYYSTVSWSEDQLLLQLLNKWYKIIN